MNTKTTLYGPCAAPRFKRRAASLLLVLLLAGLWAGAQTNYFRVLGGVPHLPVFANTAAVTSPAVGMVIYSTADAKPLVYTGSAWDTFCTSAAFGAGQATFRVAGGIPYLPAKASLTVTPSAGSMYYSSADAAVRVYDGAAWRKVSELSAGSYTAQNSFASLKEVVQLPVLAADPAPAGLSAGAIYVSSAGKAIKWYNGSAWQSVSCNAPPVVTAINVTGCSTMGSVLTAAATIADSEGDALGTPTYQWYYNTTTTGNGTAISGATASAYTLASPVDVATNKYVRVGVTPVATAGSSPGGETFSGWLLVATNAAPYFTSVGNGACLAEVGWSASALAVYADCENNPAGTHLYQWTRSNDAYGTGETTISGATASAYTFTASDVGKYIRVWMTPVATAGTLMGTIVKAGNFIGPINSSSGGPAGSLTVHHVAGSVSPVTVDITYGLVATTLFTGTAKCAITRNLGATQQAASATDNTAASAGWYWQFNRAQGYAHDGTTRTPGTVWIASISEASDWVIGNDPCRLLLGSRWRLPTRIEWDLAYGSAGARSGIANIYNTPLKVHAAGSLQSTNGSLINLGVGLTYWTSTSRTASTAWYCWGENASGDVGMTSKEFAFPLRCLTGD